MINIKKFLFLLFILLLTGCSIVRIDTTSIDNILKVVLTKNNRLFNQIGQGYKYYLPGGVTYIGSDDLNDMLYSNGVYYYLYIDAINYYYQSKEEKTINQNAYYSKIISIEDGYKYNGYIEINKEEDLYYIEFKYNYAKIEAIVNEENINNSILNASYILSTIKYNHDIIELMLKDDYFTNKTEKYNVYGSLEDNKKFVLEKENKEEG